MLRRFVYLKILNDAPIEIKFFIDRSAGFKHVCEQSGLPISVMDAYWNDTLKLAKVSTFNTPSPGCMHWLYEVEIY